MNNSKIAMYITALGQTLETGDKYTRGPIDHPKHIFNLTTLQSLAYVGVASPSLSLPCNIHCVTVPKTDL